LKVIGNPELERKRGGVNKGEKHEEKRKILETLKDAILTCTVYHDED